MASTVRVRRSPAALRYHCRACDVYGLGETCWSCFSPDALVYSPRSALTEGHPHEPDRTVLARAGWLVEHSEESWEEILATT
jgi:hypothetical protein